MAVKYELIVLHTTLSGNTSTCSYNNQKAQKELLYAKMAVNGQCVQLLCLPAWEGDNCTCMHVWVFVNGVSMYGHAVVEALWEAYRDLICEECNTRLGSQVWKHACELCLRLAVRKFP